MRRLAGVWVLLLCGVAGAAEPAPFVLPRPYFGGDGARGLELMGLERWDDARAALAAYAAAPDAPRDDAGKARLAYVSALCDRHLGRWAEAAAGFDVAAAGLPLLADYARYEGAVARYHTRELDEARARLAKIAEDAILYAESRLLLGDLLRADEKWDSVAALYHDYLTRWPNGVRVAEATFYQAEAEEKLGHVQQAVDLYRDLLIERPLASWADKAKPRLDALVPRLPPDARLRAATMGAGELETRGKVYFEAMRNDLAEADFKAVLRVKTLEKALRCEAAYHLAQTVFKERQRPRAAPLFDAAIAACAKAPQGDLHVRALYQGARSWGAAGEQKKAIAIFEETQKHVDHSLADDAALREAEQWIVLEEQGDKTAGARADAILAAIPDRFPDGDMKAEALWRLAWRAWRKGDYEATIRWLDKEIAVVPHEENYWAEGQTHYWKARALEKLRRADDARDAYARTVREYPLSYYSLLALNRLREGYADDSEKLVAELRGPAGEPEAWRFAPRPVYGEPGFQRAVELLRLGQGEAAERELSRVGLRVPDGRKKATDPDQVEKLWATALLYDRAHRYDKSHWIARWSTLDYKERWPSPSNRAKWEIAYPRGYWHIVEPAAQAQGYPPDLLMAFVREESAFDPIMESFANAIGLTQMIFPTAKRFGKGLGFDISRETLRDPEKNVAVGSRWLAFLWTTYKQHLGLVVAGYNSGEGSVWRWLCERGTWDYDEFGEAIPFDETRSYTKRVLSSYFAYSYLADRTIPALPNAIPAEAVNQRRCAAAAPVKPPAPVEKKPSAARKGKKKS
jgi:soluble lytic murein transglycosylase